MYDELEESKMAACSHLPCPIDKGRYKNPHITDIKRRFWDFLLWQAGKYHQESFTTTPPQGFRYPNPKAPIDKTRPTVSWMNHCTFHIDYKNVNILTDPIWSKRCSPFSFLGPKRLHRPPLEIQHLPHIDLVLISHDHYDHLDKRSILHIVRKSPHVLFVIPEGVGKWFKKHNLHNFIELSWWQHREIGFPGDVQLRVTAVPCQHFSGRGLLNKNMTLWCGFVLQFFEQKTLKKQLYFVGDTGYNPHDFANIGRNFGGFDLSLIPIGTYLPFTFMSPVHICPSKAVTIHQEVFSKLSIGMHWKTFCLSDEDVQQPPYDLYLAMKEMNLDPLTFRVLDPGQQMNW